MPHSVNIIVIRSLFSRFSPTHSIHWLWTTCLYCGPIHTGFCPFLPLLWVPRALGLGVALGFRHCQCILGANTFLYVAMIWTWFSHRTNVCNIEYCVLTLMISGFCEWNIWECKLLYQALMSAPWLDPMLLIFAIAYCTFSYWNTIICSIHYYWSCAGWTLYHTADVKAQSHNKRERQYGIS